nr:triacylglycerol lipase 2-like [Tanacetum cinerariifolium]
MGSFHKCLGLLWVIALLLIKPYTALGSRRLESDGGIIMNPPPMGICKSAVTKYGYKCQEIDVTTEDGFILSVQRIPEGRDGGSGGEGTRPPVLLQHGVLVDGLTWLLNSPEQSLALILADNGYDVWIANTRGTSYSRRHVSLDPSMHEFWDWTWDEIASSDLPAVIAYIFQQTNQKIHYVGHSLGTLIALASFSEGKQIDKMKSAALLSPIAYLSHMTTPLGVLAAKIFVGEVTTVFGLAEFNPKGDNVSRFLKGLCADPKVDCYNLMNSLTGKNCCLNASTVDEFLRNEPQSTSTKNLVHLAQTVRDGFLAKYDYGNPAFNMEHYGERKPPIYNLSNIPNDFPLFLSYGGQDALSDPKDVATLLDDLKLHDEGKLSVQYIKDFAHADFIMAQCSAEQHVVGGKQGWDESTDFDTWASGQTFKVDDTLVFKYSPMHSVAELGSENEYKKCDVGSATNSMSDGNSVVKLTKAGTRYFACGTMGHCDQGMKVKITTVSPSSSGSSSSSPSSSNDTPTSTSTSGTTCFSGSFFFVAVFLVLSSMMHILC